MTQLVEENAPQVERSGLGRSLRGLALPAAAIVVAVIGANPARAAGWFEDWRTGVLFAVSAIVIIVGQAFLSQYFAVQAFRESLLQRVRLKRLEADGLLARIEAARSADAAPR